MGTHFLTIRKWRVRCAKQMLSFFELKRPSQLTDVLTRDKTSLSSSGMPSKQITVRIDEAGDGPVVLKARSGSLLFFNHAGPLVIDTLPKNTSVISDHYTGTVLAKVAMPVQKQ